MNLKEEFLKGIPLEGAERLFTYYESLREQKDPSFEEFVGILKKQFPGMEIYPLGSPASLRAPNDSFEGYINNETHHTLQKIFLGVHENWGHEYGLTHDGYKAVRNGVIKKFVVNSLEEIRNNPTFPTLNRSLSL